MAGGLMIKRVFVLGYDYQCVCPEGKCYIEFKFKSLSLEISPGTFLHSLPHFLCSCEIYKALNSSFKSLDFND